MEMKEGTAAFLHLLEVQVVHLSNIQQVSNVVLKFLVVFLQGIPLLLCMLPQPLKCLVFCQSAHLSASLLSPSLAHQNPNVSAFFFTLGYHRLPCPNLSIIVLSLFKPPFHIIQLEICFSLVNSFFNSHTTFILIQFPDLNQTFL